MQCTIFNNSSNPIRLPQVFKGATLAPNTSQDFTYPGPGIPTAQLANLLAIVNTIPDVPQDPNFPNNSLTFPGNPATGIDLGLQVTPTLTYVLNNQEPQSNLYSGEIVYSITDAGNRVCEVFEWGIVWTTVGRDTWSAPASATTPSSQVAPQWLASTAYLSGGRVSNNGKEYVCSTPGTSAAYGGPSGNGVNIIDGTVHWSYALRAYPADETGKRMNFFSQVIDKQGKVYTFGGQDGNWDYTSPRALIYDTKKDVWNAGVHLPATIRADFTDPLSTQMTAGFFTRSCVLNNGKILVLNTDSPVGLPSSGPGAYVLDPNWLNSFIYDPDKDTFTLSGRLPSGIIGYGGLNTNLILLPNGKVLLAGGSLYSEQTDLTQLVSTAKCFLFDPNGGGGVGTWAATGDMHHARDQHTAVLLGDGRVMVCGGIVGIDFNYHSSKGSINSAEIYDPTTGLWTDKAPMPLVPGEDDAAVMQLDASIGSGDSSLLITDIYFAIYPACFGDLYNGIFGGGWVGPRYIQIGSEIISYTSIVAGPNDLPQALLSGLGRGAAHPVTGAPSIAAPHAAGDTITNVSTTPGARQAHAACVLSNGLVFVWSGEDYFNTCRKRPHAVLFNPTSDAIQVGSTTLAPNIWMISAQSIILSDNSGTPVGRYAPSVLPGPNNTVLCYSGYDDNYGAPAAVETYDAKRDIWTRGSDMPDIFSGDNRFPVGVGGAASDFNLLMTSDSQGYMLLGPGAFYDTNQPGISLEYASAAPGNCHRQQKLSDTNKARMKGIYDKMKRTRFSYKVGNRT